MWTRQRKRTNTGRFVVPALACAFLAYFGFHAYHGEFGIYSKYKLEERAVRLSAQLADLQREKHELERRVQLLHNGTLEKDMLDEQARKALNLSRPHEVTIIRTRSVN
jgi:cell division protein FtsB